MTSSGLHGIKRPSLLHSLHGIHGIHVLQAPQTLSFRPLTQNAFTTVFAFCAFTFTSLPNISFLAAGLAGFFRVLIMTNPGIVNLPFCTSAKARSVSAPMTFAQSAFLRSVAVASACAIPLFGKALTLFAFMAFMAFMAFIAAFFF